MNTTDAIRQYIKDHPDQIVDTAFLRKTMFPMAKEHTFIKTLTRLRDEGLVRVVDRGIYAPMTLPDDKLPDAIVRYYTDNAAGMVFGEALYCDLGLSEPTPTTIDIYTSRVTNGKNKKVMNYRLTGADIVFDKKAKDLVTLLELIENSDALIERTSTKYSETVKSLTSQDYTEELLAEITASIPYKHSTIATLRKLLGDS